MAKKLIKNEKDLVTNNTCSSRVRNSHLYIFVEGEFDVHLFDHKISASIDNLIKSLYDSYQVKHETNLCKIKAIINGHIVAEKNYDYIILRDSDDKDGNYICPLIKKVKVLNEISKCVNSQKVDYSNYENALNKENKWKNIPIPELDSANIIKNDWVWNAIIEFESWYWAGASSSIVGNIIKTQTKNKQDFYKLIKVPKLTSLIIHNFIKKICKTFDIDQAQQYNNSFDRFVKHFFLIKK